MSKFTTSDRLSENDWIGNIKHSTSCESSAFKILFTFNINLLTLYNTLIWSLVLPVLYMWLHSIQSIMVFNKTGQFSKERTTGVHALRSKFINGKNKLKHFHRHVDSWMIWYKYALYVSPGICVIAWFNLGDLVVIKALYRRIVEECNIICLDTASYAVTKLIIGNNPYQWWICTQKSFSAHITPAIRWPSYSKLKSAVTNNRVQHLNFPLVIIGCAILIMNV